MFFSPNNAFNSLMRVSEQAYSTQKELILIGLSWGKKNTSMPLGHASLIASLKKNHINFSEKIWEINRPEFSPIKVMNFLESNIKIHNPDMTYIGMGVYIWNEKIVQDLLKRIKKNQYPGKIILGGPQITHTRSNLEKIYPEANIFIRGYAEETLPNFMKLPEHLICNIPGVHLANQNDKYSIGKANTHSIPSPILSDIIEPTESLYFETKRGCMQSCAFCQYDQYPIPRKKTIDEMPFQRIEKEIEWIKKNNNIIKKISITDANFNSGKNYLEILSQLKKNFIGQVNLECYLDYRLFSRICG